MAHSKCVEPNDISYLKLENSHYETKMRRRKGEPQSWSIYIILPSHSLLWCRKKYIISFNIYVNTNFGRSFRNLHDVIMPRCVRSERRRACRNWKQKVGFKVRISFINMAYNIVPTIGEFVCASSKSREEGLTWYHASFMEMWAVKKYMNKTWPSWRLLMKRTAQLFHSFGWSLSLKQRIKNSGRKWSWMEAKCSILGKVSLCDDICNSYQGVQRYTVSHLHWENILIVFGVRYSQHRQWKDYVLS